MDFSIDFEKLIPQIQEWLAFYGLRIIAAIAIFVVGRWVAKGMRSALKRVMTKNKVDQTLVSFVCSIVYTVLIVFVVIAALNQLGIQTRCYYDYGVGSGDWRAAVYSTGA
jgi:small conductance mechanosensitive channel